MEDEALLTPSRVPGRVSPTAIRINALRALFGYFRRSCFLCCLVCVLIPLILFLAFLPIVAGIVYWSAQCDYPIATFLLVYGILPKNNWPSEDSKQWVRVTYFTFNVFAFVWFIQGCVWTYSSSSTTCDRTLYLISFWILTITIGLFAVGILISCCTFCLLYYFLIPLMSAAGGSHGLSDEEIELIPSHNFQPSEMDPEDAKCAICLSNYDQDEEVMTLPCNHHFHKDCAKVWLKSNATCPFCRAEIGKHEKEP
eukprot:c38955_g1_i1.p1 GENE.c38955_g1_i1~~c38955_g1_i1.p1  ORF type:complete len:264 (-),score=37.14 c38955_g1_i1:70-831(-)